MRCWLYAILLHTGVLGGQFAHLFVLPAASSVQLAKPNSFSKNPGSWCVQIANLADFAKDCVSCVREVLV